MLLSILHTLFQLTICTHIYHRDNAARLNAVIEADGVLILRILSPGQEVLLPPEVGLVIDHERPALHPAGAAPAQARGDLRAVSSGVKLLNFY